MKLTSYMQSFFFNNAKNEIITSNTPPEDLTKLWMDTSIIPPLLKSHDGVEWAVINKSELDAIDTRMTSAESTLNSLDGTITDICKETINTEVEGRLVGVENKTSNIVQDPDSWTASFKYTETDAEGNTKEKSNSIRLSMEGVDVGEDESYSRMARDKFAIIIEGQETTTMNKLGMETDEVYARKRFRIGDTMFIATEYGYQERWVGD